MKKPRAVIARSLRPHAAFLRTFIRFKDAESFQCSQRLIQKLFCRRNQAARQQRRVRLTRPDQSGFDVLVYGEAQASGSLPGVLWLHGGGYAIGAPELELHFIRALNRKHPCVAVLPDYALSIERPYPAGLDDCCQTLAWMKENAAALGIRSDQIFVGGDSAGGGLAVALTLRARDEKIARIAFCMPLYPMLDDRTQAKSAVPAWDGEANEQAWRLYLGARYGTEDVPAYAAPARAKNLAGLPPAYSFVGSIELFHDETVRYFERLKAAGVPAELDVYPGCFHAFDQLGVGTRIAKTATRRMQEAYGRAVKTCFAHKERES